VNQTNHFFNLGYGWLCKHCSAEDAEPHHERSGLWSFFHPKKEKAETEKKATRLPSLVLARWADAARQSLVCPRCGIEDRRTGE
jgi:hypothetical protein